MNQDLRERIVKIVDYGDEDSKYVAEIVALVKEREIAAVKDYAQELELRLALPSAHDPHTVIARTLEKYTSDAGEEKGK